MNIPRRGFLTGLGALTLTACAAKKPREIFPQIQNPVRAETEALLGLNTLLWNQILQTNHQDDIGLFAKMQNAGVQDASLVAALMSFQAQNGVTPDGNLGPETLKLIYLHVFQSNPLLSTMQAQRLEIYTSLQNYQSDRGRSPTSLPDPFDNKKFFGAGEEFAPFMSLAQTYLSQGIHTAPPQDQAQSIFIERDSSGRLTLRMYDMSGSLYLSCYVSGGTLENKSPEAQTILSGTQDGQTDLYHVSSSFPEEGNAGAPMYAATRVNDDGIWIHSSADIIDGYDHSHGCFRVGLYYARAIHDYVAKYGAININIANIY